MFFMGGLIFQSAMLAAKGKMMLYLTTQYKLCVLQGLIVEQPVQFRPLRWSIAVFVLNSDADKQNCDYATNFP